MKAREQIELQEYLDASIEVRRMLETDIELSTDIIDIAEYCVLLAQEQEKITNIIKLIND